MTVEELRLTPADRVPTGGSLGDVSMAALSPAGPGDAAGGRATSLPGSTLGPCWMNSKRRSSGRELRRPTAVDPAYTGRDRDSATTAGPQEVISAAAQSSRDPVGLS
jgi:hypothetical protein